MWSLIEKIKPTYDNCVWLAYSCTYNNAELWDELDDLQHQMEEMIINITYKDFDHPKALEIMSNAISYDCREVHLTERKAFNPDHFAEIEKRIKEIEDDCLKFMETATPIQHTDSKIFNAPITKHIDDKKCYCSWNVFTFSIAKELECKDKWIQHLIFESTFVLFSNIDYKISHHEYETADELLKIYDSRNNMDFVVAYLRSL